MDYIIITLYSVSLLLIFLFSLGQLHLTWKYLQSKKKSKGKHVKEEGAALPLVTIQLPIYNEKYVVDRLIESVTNIQYPKEKLEIQVLDDSTDETFDLAQKIIKIYRSKGFNIQHIHRTNRKGFKAGALQEGMRSASGEFVVVFDADFVPSPSFLQETIRHLQNPPIGHRRLLKTGNMGLYF